MQYPTTKTLRLSSLLAVVSIGALWASSHVDPLWIGVSLAMSFFTFLLTMVVTTNAGGSVTEVEKLFQRIAEKSEAERSQIVHIHGDVGHVLHIQSVQTLNLVSKCATAEDIQGEHK